MEWLVDLEPKAKPMGVSAVFSRRENSSRELPLTIGSHFLCVLRTPRGQGQQSSTGCPRVRASQEAADMASNALKGN
jgi:hypothetical protein